MLKWPLYEGFTVGSSFDNAPLLVMMNPRPMKKVNLKGRGTVQKNETLLMKTLVWDPSWREESNKRVFKVVRWTVVNTFRISQYFPILETNSAGNRTRPYRITLSPRHARSQKYLYIVKIHGVTQKVLRLVQILVLSSCLFWHVNEDEDSEIHPRRCRGIPRRRMNHNQHFPVPKRIHARVVLARSIQILCYSVTNQGACTSL